MYIVAKMSQKYKHYLQKEDTPCPSQLLICYNNTRFSLLFIRFNSGPGRRCLRPHPYFDQCLAVAVVAVVVAAVLDAVSLPP